MIEFSITNHSADPNQTYLARTRKLIHFTVRIQKNAQSKCKSKKNFLDPCFMLKLTTLEEIPIFYYLRYADPKKFNAAPKKNFDADPELIYAKRADPKSRIGTKHENGT
jgi:hypothetical protein